jgi:hypothetical protein
MEPVDRRNSQDDALSPATGQAATSTATDPVANIVKSFDDEKAAAAALYSALDATNKEHKSATQKHWCSLPVPAFFARHASQASNILTQVLLDLSSRGASPDSNALCIDALLDSWCTFLRGASSLPATTPGLGDGGSTGSTGIGAAAFDELKAGSAKFEKLPLAWCRIVATLGLMPDEGEKRAFVESLLADEKKIRDAPACAVALGQHLITDEIGQHLITDEVCTKLIELNNDKDGAGVHNAWQAIKSLPERHSTQRCFVVVSIASLMRLVLFISL